VTELEKETDLYLSLLSFSSPASLEEIVKRIGPVSIRDYQEAINNMVREGFLDVDSGLFSFKDKELSLKEIILEKLTGNKSGLSLKELSPDKEERKSYQKELAQMKKSGLIKTVNRRWLIS
jgi:hypothetical protein